MNQIPDLIQNIKDTKQREMALLILTRLLRDGIKDYMKEWFNEDEQVLIIERIFNTIIIPNFEKKDDNITTYRNNSSDSEDDQRVVFNTNDIMCLIFQFLEYQIRKQGLDGDLLNCSLVNLVISCMESKFNLSHSIG